MAASVIDRASADDMVSLATDVGAVPMQVGAVLLIDSSDGFDVEHAATVVGERIRSVPRLRQRLVPTPVGCGRPVWVDAADFELGDHVDHLPCPPPGDEGALLELAARTIGRRLPPERPLWRLRIVTGVDGGRAALIIVFHHVLADGMGGLAVLANLVDGAPPGPATPFPRPPHSNRQLAFDAARSRLAAVTRMPAGVGRVRAALAQLRPTSTRGAQRCSLQRPTGERRRVAVVRAVLDDVSRTAHAHGATVNDVVLTAVAGALHALLQTRGEHVDRFVISVPMSARREANADQLGNQVGVVPLEIPATGDPADRLHLVTELTSAAKQTTRAASTAVLGPIFRVLARLGLFTWFIERQHLVHTFVTNLRGPEVALSFAGSPIIDVIPVAMTAGNVSVSFGVMSYAGHLDITVLADPDACPDLDVLLESLRTQLDALLTMR